MKEKFIETCKKIAEQEGACNNVNCEECPFSSHHNEDQCGTSGIASNPDSSEKDLVLLKSAIKYLEENMCENKVVLEGTEYDLNDYEIKDIEDYSGCHPLVAYLLQRGQMVRTQAGFCRYPTNYPPLKKPTKVVKSREQIYLQLIHDGYVGDNDGSWGNSNDAAPNFLFSMFNYCGKEPSPHHTWRPQWLEER